MIPVSYEIGGMLGSSEYSRFMTVSRSAGPTRSTIGDRRNPAVAAARQEMADLICGLRRGLSQLNRHTLDGWVFAPSTALAIIRAARHHARAVVLSGKVAGNLDVSGRVAGNLDVSGQVAGNLNVSGQVAGNLNVSGQVAGNLNVSGRVAGDLVVGAEGKVAGDLVVFGEVAGNLVVDVAVVFGEVAWDLARWGQVAGNLLVRGEGRVAGDLVVLGEVAGNLDVSGEVAGNLNVLFGEVAGSLVVFGEVAGDLTLTAGVEQCILTGRVGGRTVLTPRPTGTATLLRSVRRGTFGDEVFVGDHVDISGCDFRQCPDLDRFLFVGAHLFPEPAQGLANPPANSREVVPHLEMAAIYRQLRANTESRRNRASAGTFYRGEMDSRREAAWQQRRWAEWWVVSIYKWMSGYGLVARRAIGWLVSLVMIGAGLYYFTGSAFDPYANQPPLDLFGAVQFSFESTVGLLRPPGDNLQFWERWLQLLQRVAGPVLLAQAVLAIRERVAR
jgi:cytoskeletal protein CcmA (bactofilin family)